MTDAKKIRPIGNEPEQPEEVREDEAEAPENTPSTTDQTATGVPVDDEGQPLPTSTVASRPQWH